jgi:hypothetical protein
LAGRPQLRWFALASWPAGYGIGQGRREEGKDDGTYVQKTKTAGLSEKGAKNYSSQGQIKNI